MLKYKFLFILYIGLLTAVITTKILIGCGNSPPPPKQYHCKLTTHNPFPIMFITFYRLPAPGHGPATASPLPRPSAPGSSQTIITLLVEYLTLIQ